MLLLDHFLFSIYKTYLRINRVIKLYYEPVPQASSTAAILFSGLFFSITIYVGLWRKPDKIILPYLCVFFTGLILFFLGSYFEKRIRKIRTGFETRKRNLFLIIAINFFIGISYYWIFRMLNTIF